MKNFTYKRFSRSKNALLRELLRTEIDVSVPKGWIYPTAHRVAEGVEFLATTGIPFCHITERENFCMMDNRRDVLSEAGPCLGAGIRVALGARKRVLYGFYPPQPPILCKQWDILLKALWRTASRYFQRRPGLCVH